MCVQGYLIGELCLQQAKISLVMQDYLARWDEKQGPKVFSSAPNCKTQADVNLAQQSCFYSARQASSSRALGYQLLLRRASKKCPGSVDVCAKLPARLFAWGKA